jgi:pimeloyl-ACP methyl ester carboxylesterase
LPALLLVGEDSPGFIKVTIEALGKALPHSRIAAVPGQRHIAMYAAPNLFVDELLDFLEPETKRLRG